MTTGNLTFEFTRSQGIQLHWRRHSNPGRPRLVLFGAWPQTIRCWDQVWDGLAGEYDLLALDMPGFGRSGDAPELMSPSKMAGFVGAFLDEQGFGKAHLIAPDVAVPMALSLAARRPELVESLVIADGPGCYPAKMSWDLQSLALMGKAAPARDLMGLGSGLLVRTAMRNSYRKYRPSKELRQEYISAYGAAGRLSTTFRYLGSYTDELPVIDRNLSGIEAPVLILWGAQDVYLPPANAHDIGGKLRRSSVRILEGAGHFSHEDAAPEFIRHISDWCSGGCRTVADRKSATQAA